MVSFIMDRFLPIHSNTSLPIAYATKDARKAEIQYEFRTERDFRGKQTSNELCNGSDHRL